MERTNQRIDEIKQIVCEYYNIDPIILDEDTRKNPRPMARQLISYFSNIELNITQQQLADYWNKKTHASICIAINNVYKLMDVDKQYYADVKNLDRIIKEKGLSLKFPKNNHWYKFVDLNNFVLASKGAKSILLVNMTFKEIAELNLSGYDLEEQKETGKFYYTRLKQVTIKNK